ncbi:hypothetical protein POPTR_008G113301v4 [Populus trichocarpa]|uniref:Uncharacterized protein n=1 Tax=Populus trichocarpa TaxID=3694 RepID=A0ACC0SL39_POPTR|nr:hypothetical protein POPTR_008G113301v4 [Populus trichocarpa]
MENTLQSCLIVASSSLNSIHIVLPWLLQAMLMTGRSGSEKRGPFLRFELQNDGNDLDQLAA